jgi:hypothetical protein
VVVVRRHGWLWVGGVIAAACAALPPIGFWLTNRATRSARERLDRAAATAQPASLIASDRVEADLPIPVARYLSRALSPEQPEIQAVELTTDGEFRMGDAEDSWRPFHATQRCTTAPAGFVWSARIAMTRFAPVYVRDAYVSGRGETVGKILGLYPVVNQSGVDELALGQLTRYLAEAMWFPTALRPRPGLTWRALDAHAAIVSLVDHGRTTSLRFTFDDTGDVTEVFAHDRLRETNGRYLPTPWAVRCWRPEVQHGIRNPMECESEWQLTTGPLPYWRGRVTQIAFEYADSAR